jgi:hypothetical protein
MTVEAVAPVVAAILLLSATPAPLPPLERTRWREAAEYLPLFTPARPALPEGGYRTYVSSLSLDAVLGTIAAADAPPGAWEPHPLPPSEAFGQSGRYDRWKLARLYGARRALVARGPRRENGRVIETWTLISPYPDARLDKLEPGTLLIVLRLAAE